MGLPTAVLLRTQSDERLVALVRDGHERAFETIVRRLSRPAGSPPLRSRRPLLGACQRICADGRGEDVLQQALLSAWAGLLRGDDVRDLRAWLYRIVRNAAVSHRRRSGQDGLELVDTLSIAPSPEEEAERRAVVQETLAAIAELPDRQREALLRIAVQGHSQDEVAGELGLSAVAVRQLVHRARTALRAAATAVVPLPVVSWAASLGGSDAALAPRVAGLVAGAGGTGATATLLKAGAVAGVAATAVSAPLLTHRHGAAAPAAVIAPPAVAVATPRPTATAAPRPVATSAPHPAAAAHGEGARVAVAHREAASRHVAARDRGPSRRSVGGREHRSGGEHESGGDGDSIRDSAPVPTGGDGHDGGGDSRGDDDRREAVSTPVPTITPLPTVTVVPTATATEVDGDGHDGGGDGSGDDGHDGGH